MIIQNSNMAQKVDFTSRTYAHFLIVSCKLFLAGGGGPHNRGIVPQAALSVLHLLLHLTYIVDSL